MTTPMGTMTSTAATGFMPPQINTVEDTGLSPLWLQDLALKILYFRGYLTGFKIAEEITLPFAGVMDQILMALKQEKLIEVKSSQGGLGEGAYTYGITGAGIVRAREALDRSQYAGPAPVPFDVYNDAIRRQKSGRLTVTTRTMRQILAQLVISESTFQMLGPALNSGTSVFLYGPPGNGKTSIARAFGNLMLSQTMYIPHALYLDGQVIKVYDAVRQIAPSRATVLIQGETGTGKELIAKAIHGLSGLQGKFVPVNVAGLDDNMFSDTLFGHRRGAFTGADQARSGLIAQASGGTLFLDEIGDLTEVSQVKLLRLLQEQEYYPVGSDITMVSDARIIAATNRDLRKLTGEGKFRNDLYFRLCAHQVHAPPLRERLEDIPVLLEHFLDEAARTFKKKKPAYPHELKTLLSTYDFPGNVREMKAIVFDAVARHGAGVLSMESFREVIGTRPVPVSAGSNPAKAAVEMVTSALQRLPTVREVEDYLIGEAMKAANGNQGIAASLIGFTRQTLNKRLKKKRTE